MPGPPVPSEDEDIPALSSCSPSAPTPCFQAGLGRSGRTVIPGKSRQAGGNLLTGTPSCQRQVLEEGYPLARNGCEGPTVSGFGLDRTGCGLSHWREKSLTPTSALIHLPLSHGPLCFSPLEFLYRPIPVSDHFLASSRHILIAFPKLTPNSPSP